MLIAAAAFVGLLGVALSAVAAHAGKGSPFAVERRGAGAHWAGF